MSEALSLNDELVAILAALPAETLADELMRSESQVFLYHCLLTIDASVMNWPDRKSMGRLASFEQGYGCWIEEIRYAIDRAALDPHSRDLWLVAHAGAAALLFAYHIRGKGRASIEDGNA